MHLLCTYKQDLILYLCRLHVAAIWAIYTTHHNTILIYLSIKIYQYYVITPQSGRISTSTQETRRTTVTSQDPVV